ncbi:MAG: hypothetical protein ACETWM_11330 [Candidatus Lokiarchaeia archaeon]
MFGKKPSLERGDKAFTAAYESEKRGQWSNAVKNYVEAIVLYGALKNQLMEAEANYFAGHCSLLEAIRAETINEFKKLLKKAKDFWESTRKIHIKLEVEDIKPDIRGAIIDSSLILSDLADLFDEHELSKRKSEFFDIIGGLEKCSEIYQKYENFERAGIAEYWAGFVKLSNYNYLDIEKHEEILTSAIINFNNSEKFLQNANKERPSLCFSSLVNKAKIARVLESREPDETKRMILSTIREDITKSQEEDLPTCEGYLVYNLSWVDFEQAAFVKNIDERSRLLKNTKKLAEEALSDLIKNKEQSLTMETYFISALASKELVEMIADKSKHEALLKSAYENFKECIKHARILEEIWIIAKVLAELPGISADYSEFIQSEVLKREILREGASFGREALEYVKKLPNDFRFLGKLYENMAKYVLTTSMIDEGKELTAEELERVRDLRTRAFRYGERAVEYFEKISKKNTAFEITSKAGYLFSKVGVSDQEKIEILERAESFAETAIERHKSKDEDLRAAKGAYSLGLICEDLWQLTNQDENYRKAKSSFADASKLYTNVNWIESSALCLRKLAELDDRKGNYKMASDYYLEASKKYEQAAIEQPDFRDHVKFARAMYNIELAKDKEREDWKTAKEYYEKALPIFPKIYDHEAKFYAAKIKLLEAESVSMGKEGEKAAELFSSAAQMFRGSTYYLKPGLETSHLISIANMFADFVEAKGELEKGLISSKEGKHEAAIVHFKSATEKMEILPTKTSLSSEDVDATINFIKALSELEKAQIDNNLENYQAAAKLFQEGPVLFTKERMKNISKGYSDLCYGIENLVRCMEAEKDPMNEYINATTYFERSQKFFQEAELSNYVDYLEAMKNYLDGIRYGIKIKLELVDEAKTSYYTMIEKSFKNAIDNFRKSGYIYLKERASSELEKIKREKTLYEYLSLVESIKTPEGEEGYTVSIPREAFEKAFVILRVVNPIAHSVFKIGEEITVNFEITNVGAKTATLDRIENITPPDFLIQAEENSSIYIHKASINLNRKTLKKGQTEKLATKIRPSKPGSVNYQPILIYSDEKKNKKFFKLNIPILVSE